MPRCLAGFGQQKHFAAVLQTVRAHCRHNASRFPALDTGDHRLGHAAGDRVIASVAGSQRKHGVFRLVVQFNGTRAEHAHQFFKCDDVVDKRPDLRLARLKLLCDAGAYEDDPGIRIQSLDPAGCRNHGCVRAGYAVAHLREILACHLLPGRTAGCPEKLLVVSDFFHELIRFVDGPDVGAQPNLDDIQKTKRLQTADDFAGRGEWSELTDKGWRDRGIDAMTVPHGRDQLEYFRLVGNGGKRAADNTKSAGNTFLLVDARATDRIAADRVHAAGFSTGTSGSDYRLVGASLDTSSAADAFLIVDNGGIASDRDCLDRTYGGAGVRQAFPAVVGDQEFVRGAGFAGERNDVDKRPVKMAVHISDFRHAVRERMMHIRWPLGQAERQPQPLFDDRAFLVDTVPVQGDFAWYDLVWGLVQGREVIAVQRPFVGEPGDFRKDLAPDLGDGRIQSTHNQLPRQASTGCGDLENPFHDAFAVRFAHQLSVDNDNRRVGTVVAGMIARDRAHFYFAFRTDLLAQLTQSFDRVDDIHGAHDRALGARADFDQDGGHDCILLKPVRKWYNPF